MKFDRDEAKTASHFDSLYLEYGNSFKALDWGSSKSQELRFQVLASMADLQNASILDVGCGLGHFYSWFKTYGEPVNYTGIDIAQDILECARDIHPDGNFHHASIITMNPEIHGFYDYVFASGIFSTYTKDSYDYLSETVMKMWQFCRKGLGFNSLSTWARTKNASEFYADPGKVLDICRIHTGRVVLRHDYHPNDFSVFMYKDS